VTIQPQRFAFVVGVRPEKREEYPNFTARSGRL
jgi:hypothetical protein